MPLYILVADVMRPGGEGTRYLIVKTDSTLPGVVGIYSNQSLAQAAVDALNGS